MLAQTSAARFHPTLKKIIPQWHWAVLVLCFQHIQMLSKLNCIQKSFFHDSFPPNFGVLQFKFYWKFHWKQALLFHLFLLQKPEAFFHANRCHEPSYSLIQFDALLIIWNSAVACSFTLLTCTSQSDKKSFMRRHYHQLPFFRRKILLFTNENFELWLVYNLILLLFVTLRERSGIRFIVTGGRCCFSADLFASSTRKGIIPPSGMTLFMFMMDLCAYSALK